jgi:hypothetical protein
LRLDSTNYGYPEDLAFIFHAYAERNKIAQFKQLPDEWRKE